jgi:uncharacterized protein with GYD domain
MRYYLLQVAYTPEVWAAMLLNPHNCLEEVRSVIERLGGKLEGSWLALGEYDAVVVCQMPDHVSAVAVSMAISAQGIMKAIKTTPLVTVEESLEALKKAAGATGQLPPITPQSANLPVLRSRQGNYKEVLAASYKKLRQKMGKLVTGQGE